MMTTLASHATDKYSQNHHKKHTPFTIDSTTRLQKVSRSLLIIDRRITSTVRHLDLDNVPPTIIGNSPPSSSHGEIFLGDKKFGALAVAV